MISNRFDNRIARKGNFLLQTDILRRGAHLDDELARLDVPLANAIVRIVTKLIGVERYLHRLGLTRLEGNACKALQLLGPDVLVLARRREIDLGNLVGSHLARILHLKRQADSLSRGINLGISLQILVFKGGVAQSIAEGPLDT